MTPKLTAISGAIQRNLESAIIVNPAEQNEALRKLCDRHLY
jgi:acetylglutamate kinase